MNSRVCKWLVSFAVFLCLMFVASTVAAKKPEKNPPNTDDPCAKLLEFTPDFAFYRDTGRGKNPTFTFFVADSQNGCEKPVLAFTRSEGLIHGLRFSASRENGSYFGRIVWKTISDSVRTLWNYDFGIVGVDVEHVDGPRLIMDNSDDTNKKISVFDLSPDRKTLVYKFWITGEESSIRLVHVDACTNTGGCTLDPEISLALAEVNEPGVDFMGLPAWGLYGDRVYFTRHFESGPEYNKLQYIDLPVGWNDPWPELPSFTVSELTLVSTLVLSDFPLIYKIASGNIGEDEVLAVRIPSGECYDIAFINLNLCDPTMCEVVPKFYGTNASWTWHGGIIHNYTRDGSKLCSKWGGTVGLFDGTEVTSVLKGFMPDAAGSVPLQ